MTRFMDGAWRDRWKAKAFAPTEHDRVIWFGSSAWPGDLGEVAVATVQRVVRALQELRSLQMSADRVAVGWIPSRDTFRIVVGMAPPVYVSMHAMLMATPDDIVESVRRRLPSDHVIAVYGEPTWEELPDDVRTEGNAIVRKLDAKLNARFTVWGFKFMWESKRGVWTAIVNVPGKPSQTLHVVAGPPPDHVVRQFMQILGTP